MEDPDFAPPEALRPVCNPKPSPSQSIHRGGRGHLPICQAINMLAMLPAFRQDIDLLANHNYVYTDETISHSYIHRNIHSYITLLYHTPITLLYPTRNDTLLVIARMWSSNPSPNPDPELAPPEAVIPSVNYIQP